MCSLPKVWNRSVHGIAETGEVDRNNCDAPTS